MNTKLCLKVKYNCSRWLLLGCYLLVEEVAVKWMERPSATEMERERASEMDRRTKCHKNENATEMNKI